MTDETFTARLHELSAKMRNLSPTQREALHTLLQETKDRQIELRKNIARAHDALDDWRVTVKYALFDREARRRERRH